jgi:hypothetical protein
MTMTMVETRPVTGGVDTHLDTHVAAALDAIGGVLGVESFEATATWAITPMMARRSCSPPLHPGVPHAAS